MKCLGDSGVMLLIVAAYSLITLSTCLKVPCRFFVRDTTILNYVTIGNIGFKLCQIRCIGQGGCLSFEYDLEHLTCHLLRAESKNFEENARHIFRLRNLTDVPTGPCVAKSCSVTSRCLKARSGKTVCVTGGKQFSPERYIQHKPCDQEGRSMDNQLHDACWEGDLNMVRRILSEGQLDVNSRDRRERTPVMAAACAGHKDVVKLLINAGGNVSLVEDQGYNIFHIATCIGHLGMVKYILSQNIVDINSRTKCNRTPVMMAANRGYRDVFAVLVSKGADVSSRDQRGNNILLYTCAGGQVEMVKYVLSLNKVDINSRGQRGWTSVMVAARLGNREMLDFLVSKGSNVSLTANEDNNILHAACIGGHLEMVKYVVSQDFVDINSRRWTGRTPLMLSAMMGHRDVFDFVLSRGGNMLMVTKQGKNILHLVCQKGNLDMVKFILSKNLLDINARTNKGKTATLIARQKKNIELYDFLASHGGK